MYSFSVTFYFLTNIIAYARCIKEILFVYVLFSPSLNCFFFAWRIMENRAMCTKPFNYRQRVGDFGLCLKREGVHTIVTGRLYNYTICDFKHYLEEEKLARLTTLENKLQTHQNIFLNIKKLCLRLIKTK